MAETSLLVIELGRITVPSTQDLLDRVSDDLADVPTLEVDSESMAEVALRMSGRFATVIDAMDTERLSTTKPIRDAVSQINDGYNPAIDTLKKAKDTLNKRLVEWNRVVAERKRKAEAEAAAERKRQADEAAAEAAKKQAEAQKLIDDAKAAQAAGDSDKAADLVQQAQATADAAQQVANVAEQARYTPTVYSGPSRVKGATETWSAVVVDRTKYILFVAERIQAGDTSLLDSITINETFLSALARLQKQSLALPGIEPRKTERVATRKVGV